MAIEALLTFSPELVVPVDAVIHRPSRRTTRCIKAGSLDDDDIKNAEESSESGETSEVGDLAARTISFSDVFG